MMYDDVSNRPHDMENVCGFKVQLQEDSDNPLTSSQVIKVKFNVINFV